MAGVDLKFTVAALDKAAATFIKLAQQVERLSNRLDKLDGKIARVQVVVDGQDKAEAGLDNVERKRKNLDGKKATVKVDVDKSLSDSLIKINLLGKAMRAIALPAAAIAAAPQIAALGSAAVAATGAIGILPGVVGAAGLAAGTASVAFGGLIKYFTADSPKKQAEAYATLTASGKQLADTIKGLTPQFQSLRTAVQDAAMQGFVNQVKPLASAYLPLLQREMVKVAEGFNVAGLSLAKFFQQKNTVADLQGAFMSMRIAVNNTIVALKPLAQAFVDIFVTSTARLPGLTKGIGDAAAHFAAFIKTARETGQLGAWIDKGLQTVKLLGETVLHVGSILLSVFRSASTEGGNMVRTMAEVTGKIAEMLKSAKGQNALAAVFDTIRAAVVAVTPVIQALLPLIGTALVAAGTTLVAVFQALGPPLRDVAIALSHSLAPVLPGIATAFGQIALALVPIVAPVTALIPAFDSIARAIAEAANVAAAFFTAMAGTGAAIFKAIIPLITGAADALTALLHIIEPIAPALGVMTAAFLSFKAASGAISSIQDVIKGVGVSIAWAGLRAGEFTTAITGSAVAGEKLSAVTGKLNSGLRLVGVALPIIAVVAAGIALTYDLMKDKSNELTDSVAAGQRTMGEAIAEQSGRIQNQKMVMQEMGGEAGVVGQGIGELTGQLDANADSADATAIATKQITDAHEKWLGTLPPLEAAQARLKDAQDAYNAAVAQFTADSPQAIAAHDNLVTAKDNLKRANDDAALAEKTLGDRITETANAAAAAANADVGYQQSVLTLRDAQDRAAEAADKYGAKSREAAQANLAVQQASLSAAAAAQRKAEADATAAGASNVAQIGAQAYKDELLRQAETMTGPAKQALIDLANGTNTAKQSASTAEIASRLYKDELQKLADQATGPTKSALEEGKRKLDEIASGHGTAQQKADAQRAMLQKLADQTTGPTHDAIMGMIHDLGAIPKETDFTVKGVGQVSYGSPELLRAAHGGHTGGIVGMNRAGQVTGVAYADGGVMPGYTPGRDVHRFQSANGSVLDLSGGEAVMRPEWTRAVSPSYVKAANAVARSKGVAGVMEFIGRTAPRRSGEGVQGDGSSFAKGGIIGGRYAGGGMVLTGTPFRDMPPKLFNTVAGSLVSTITSVLNAAIKNLAAEAAAGVSGIAGGGAQAALNFARSQVGKPYIWGAVGPRGYDCSGFMSAVLNVLQGRSPYSRRGSTGSFPWPGFAPGLGGQFAIGSFRGNPGHMAGTLSPGINVESNGSQGVRVGGPTGAASRMFVTRAHVGDRGGMLQAGSAALNTSGQPERLLDPMQTQILDQIRAAIAGGGMTPGGSGNGDLLSVMRALNSNISALRGDVDHHGDQAAIAANIGVTNRLLAGLATGTAAGAAQNNRTVGDLGPF